jgi:acyl carrier protein
VRHTRWCLIALALVANGCAPKEQPGTGNGRPGTPDAAEKAVREVIADLLKVDAEAIPMDRPISDPPLTADDLDLVEIVMELEDRLGIEIADADIEGQPGGALGKGPVRITPNQLAAVARKAPKAQQPKRKK